MNELGAFSTLAAFGFACLDDVRVLILEPSLVQLLVVDVESMGHLSDGTHIACIDVVLSDVLGLLIVQLSRRWVNETRLVRPGKACRYTRLVEDTLTLRTSLRVEVVGRCVSVCTSKSIVDVSVDLGIDRSFRCDHFWRYD